LSLIKKFLQQPETRWLLVFAACPLLFGSTATWWAYQEQDFINSLGPITWLLVFLALSLPIVLSLFPNTLVGLITGYFLSWWALPGMVLSFMLASFLGFLLGRRLDAGLKSTFFQIWPASREAVDRMQGDPVQVVAAFRLLPVPPFAIGNLLLAWLEIPLKPYLFGSLMGMLPRMAFVVWLGSGLSNLLDLVQNPSSTRYLNWFSWLVLIPIWLFFRRYFRSGKA
jgi:uncharacterized membrane protein YdjX (TVP38/TMEM64 family)